MTVVITPGRRAASDRANTVGGYLERLNPWTQALEEEGDSLNVTAILANHMTNLVQYIHPHREE